ncbi:aminotransferase class III-fold pyridoxal phosphate-dependent enzyme [Thalassospira sp.]|uniref:aminotransferase class III-fold pyridoxal phosphate-dependent enzyme n=1 Tax=Thalassospira sp. TaxID=1912094 RepID=UPI001B078F2A|nr:aminotransferase class III-fold pyridoxal phosphate-dependent enzyme [Thalassospira sp.]MBO6805975.1 aminotransferase class III-fold pyridoxal phosphate-dependent enzyme [Thalassospira sp.]
MSISNKYSKSGEWLQRTLHSVPTASQTFSKSYIQFPKGHAPLFVERAKGACFEDVDGNSFVDMIMGLAAVGLGYCDPDVDRAVSAQLSKGMTFSLPTRLEAELAEQIIDIVPSAEMVRFGKNGSDATSAGVRLARAYTGRSNILACGYHGWHDWYIGSTSRNLGVPHAITGLTHKASANNVDEIRQKLEEYPKQFALIIVEPMLLDTPKKTLSEIQQVAKEHGCLLMFDEVATGFRFALGGAQQLYGVTPDLTSFGKSMANGLPLSAIVGRRDVMKLMDDVFISGSFGGEALSLAGSLATIEKFRAQKVTEHIWSYGKKLQSSMRASIDKWQLNDVISVVNEPCLGFIAVNAGRGETQPVIRTFMLAEMIRQGVFLNGSLTVCYAFGDTELAKVTDAFEVFAAKLNDELRTPGLEQRLPYPAIKPIFSIRKSRDGNDS